MIAKCVLDCFNSPSHYKKKCRTWRAQYLELRFKSSDKKVLGIFGEIWEVGSLDCLAWIDLTQADSCKPTPISLQRTNELKALWEFKAENISFSLPTIGLEGCINRGLVRSMSDAARLLPFEQHPNISHPNRHHVHMCSRDFFTGLLFCWRTFFSQIKNRKLARHLA
jgi:hypothetical protein